MAEIKEATWTKKNYRGSECTIKTTQENHTNNNIFFSNQQEVRPTSGTCVAQNERHAAARAPVGESRAAEKFLGKRIRKKRPGRVREQPRGPARRTATVERCQTEGHGNVTVTLGQRFTEINFYPHKLYKKNTDK